MPSLPVYVQRKDILVYVFSETFWTSMSLRTTQGTGYRWLSSQCLLSCRSYFIHLTTVVFHPFDDDPGQIHAKRSRMKLFDKELFKVRGIKVRLCLNIFITWLRNKIISDFMNKKLDWVGYKTIEKHWIENINAKE